MARRCIAVLVLVVALVLPTVVAAQEHPICAELPPEVAAVCDFCGGEQPPVAGSDRP